MVYVQDTNGKPLMPTTRYARVKRLLRRGEATVVCKYPFTIRLKTEKKRYVQPISLGVDTGSRHIGLSATTNKKELYSAVAEARHDIVKLISDRRMYRRIRHYRLRYRPARFNNRVASKRKGWLPPSTLNNIQFHMKLIAYMRRLLPITEIHLELGSFDTQKMENVDISGIEYQHGPQEGFDNVKAYVKWRDGYKCRMCGSDKYLEVHHIESRKTGGNSPGNLVTLCEDCHRKVHAGEKLKLKRTKSMRDAAKMNTVKNRIFEEANKVNPDIPVYRTYGYITAAMRRKNRIEKTHNSDARVISGNPLAEPIMETWELQQVRRHNRQIHRANRKKGGILMRAQSDYVTKGFRLNDIVRYKGELYMIIGRRSSGSFALRSLSCGPKVDGVSYKKLVFVAAANRLIKILKSNSCPTPPPPEGRGLRRDSITV